MIKEGGQSWSNGMPRKQVNSHHGRPDSIAVKIIEITKGLEYYRNRVNKAVAGFERIDSNFERSSIMDKLLSNSIACYRETVHEKEN